MSISSEVIVIGGGIMGASAAYHLAAHGCPGVTLLEAGEMYGMGSTGLNAGGVRHQFSTAVNIQLSRLSFAMMARFDEEMGVNPSLTQCGYLFLLDNESDLQRFSGNVALQNAHGVPSCVIDVTDVAKLAPEVALDGVLGGSWCELDGLVDPSALLQGYTSAAARGGARLYTNARVLRIARTPSGTFSVVTRQATHEAPVVLIAAGAWSAEVGALAGVELPIQPVRRQIAVTRPIDGLRAGFPFVIDFSKALYFHRESGGILTGMSNRDEKPGFDSSIDEAWRHQHLECAIARLPLLAEAQLAAEWAGLYEVTPDDQPILGSIPGHEGLYVCAGFSGHGLMHGPAAGLIMAEEILEGCARTVNIDALRWSRFADGPVRGEYNVV